MLFQVSFGKPIEAKKLAEFDLLATNPKSDADIERIYLLAREGFLRGALQEFSERQAATSRFLLASLLVNDDDIVSVIRRELRRVTEMLVDPEVIKQVLRQEVIKREALEGPAATEAERLLARRDRQRAPKPSPADPTKPASDPSPSVSA